jgi:hypothetical protein
MYMKMSQGNTPCSDLKQTKNKDVIFFFYKIEEQEARTGPAWEGWYQGEEQGKERE